MESREQQPPKAPYIAATAVNKKIICAAAGALVARFEQGSKGKTHLVCGNALRGMPYIVLYHTYQEKRERSKDGCIVLLIVENDLS